MDNLKTPDNQKNKKDKEISKSKERPAEQPPGTQFAISVERTDDITYDIGDKKIHSNIKKNYQYNNYKTNNDKSDYKVESEDSTAQKYSDNQNKKIIIIQVQIMIGQALELIRQNIPIII